MGALQAQLLQNPEMMSQMMQNPMMQQSMQMFMRNPELMRQAMQNHPMMANNPEMVRCHYWWELPFDLYCFVHSSGYAVLSDGKEVAGKLPGMCCVCFMCCVAQMAGGEMQELFNPQNMQAMMQVQQGMAQLQQNAPGLFSSMSG